MSHIQKTRHDGDCYWWALSKICTCGYLHEVAFRLDSATPQEQEQYGIHMGNLSRYEGIIMGEWKE